jgi:hypothetical protein
LPAVLPRFEGPLPPRSMNPYGELAPRRPRAGAAELRRGPVEADVGRVSGGRASIRDAAPSDGGGPAGGARIRRSAPTSARSICAPLRLPHGSARPSRAARSLAHLSEELSRAKRRFPDRTGSNRRDGQAKPAAKAAEDEFGRSSAIRPSGCVRSTVGQAAQAAPAAWRRWPRHRRAAAGQSAGSGTGRAWEPARGDGAT